MKGKLAVRRGGYLLVALLAGIVSAHATASDSPSSRAVASGQAQQGGAEQQIRAAHQQLLDAVRKDDKAAARELMADELSWVTVTGNVAGKDELLGHKPTPPPDVKVDQVQTFGNAGVVIGSGRFEDGRELRFLQEWVNRDGQWKLLAHQGTLVAAMPPAGQASATAQAAGTSGHGMKKGSAPMLASDEERAVWMAQTELHKAFLAGDTATYGKLTSDDFVRVGPHGERQGSSEFLQNVKQNAGRSAGQIETGDPKITVSGDTARVLMTTWGTMPGGEEIAAALVTRVFVKRNGQWQQAAAIFTPVAAQK